MTDGSEKNRGVSHNCDGKCFMNDSWLSEITVKLLTGSRGHCSVVCKDGKILQGAEKALKEEQSLMSRLS